MAKSKKIIIRKKRIEHKKKIMHNRLLITLIVLVVLLILIFKLPEYVDFIGEAMLMLQTPSPVNAGSQLKLDILASGVIDLAGVQVSVGYNPTILKYDHTIEGNFLKAGGTAQTLFLNTLSISQAGLVKDIVIVKIGAGVSGSGLIASIYFNATNTGYSDLTMQDIQLSDSNGNPISAGIINTNVSVVQPVADTTPPTRSDGAPSGILVAGTTSTILSLTTDEPATCRYSTTANSAYSSMTNIFSTTGGTSHSTTITGLVNGNNYVYYVKCMDAAGNANTN